MSCRDTQRVTSSAQERWGEALRATFGSETTMRRRQASTLSVTAGLHHAEPPTQGAGPGPCSSS
jgi:hypothetical protein